MTILIVFFLVFFLHDLVIIRFFFSFFFDVLGGAETDNFFENVSFSSRFNIRIEGDVDAVLTIFDVLNVDVGILKKKRSKAFKWSQ